MQKQFSDFFVKQNFAMTILRLLNADCLNRWFENKISINQWPYVYIYIMTIFSATKKSLVWMALMTTFSAAWWKYLTAKNVFGHKLLRSKAIVKNTHDAFYEPTNIYCSSLNSRLFTQHLNNLSNNTGIWKRQKIFFDDLNINHSEYFFWWVCTSRNGSKI